MSSGVPSSRERFRRALGRGLGLLAVLAPLYAGVVRAQVVDVDLRTTGFLEPSPSSNLLVINPVVAVAGRPSNWLKIQASYEADIVSGASESVKAGRLGGVDVVSAATSFQDTRHVFSGGVSIERDSTELSASYGYGTESDYRSQSITVSAATTFLQKNTELRLAYGRGFDDVCTTAFADADAPSSRLPLDSSKGCFTETENRASRALALDSFQVGWTQTWTPVVVTQLVLTGALNHGFLANPYRGVVIASAGDTALENHPDNRARIAAQLRSRLYVRAIKTAFGLGVHVYRDTWDVLGRTLEIDAERYFLPGLRAQLRGRLYSQSGALFFSDDYTGGEPVDGPRGQYWTGDRELSPLSSYSLGGRVVFGRQAPPDARLLGALLSASASAGLDVMKTDLNGFTWGGVKPDDTFAALLTISLSGSF